MAFLRGHFILKDDGILPHLAMFPSSDGMLPLHYAAAWSPLFPSYNAAALRNAYTKSGGQIAVVEHFLKVYPQTMTIRDGSGRLPLHCAVEVHAPL